MSASAYIGAAVTIGLFLISHLVVAIWFASRVSTRVDVMAATLVTMSADLKGLAALDKRCAVLEERVTRSETDVREVLKAAALLGRSQ